MGASRGFSDDIVDFGTLGIKDKTAISVCVWVFLNNVTQDHWIFGDFASGTPFRGLLIQFDQANAAPPFDETYQFALFGTSGSFNFHMASFLGKANVWQCIGLAWDKNKDNGAAFTYLDGIRKQDGGTPGPNNLGGSSASYQIGKGPAAFSGLDGKVAHVQVWSRKITDAEMRDATWKPGSVRG